MNNKYLFSIFRILFGLYLSIHFIMLIPYSSELLSNIGLLSDFTLNPTHEISLNILYLFDSPIAINVFLSLMVGLSFLFMSGIKRNLTSLLLWYGYYCIFNRNLFISNPSLPYVGLLLLFSALIPEGEELSLGKKATDWQLDRKFIYWGNFILGLGYTISGIHKLSSPSWANGQALFQLLSNPLSRDVFYKDILLQFPEILTVLTFGVLFLEIIYLFLIFNNKSRKYAWWSMILMHIGIIFLIDFADLSFGMIMFHLFLFEKSFIKAKTLSYKITVKFDASCMMCNQFIKFLLSIDYNDNLLFSSLSENELSEIDSIKIIHEDKFLYKSDAILYIFSKMGSFWYILSLLKIVPKNIRDYIYDIIAKNRHYIFKNNNQCTLLSQNDKIKFIN